MKKSFIIILTAIILTVPFGCKKKNPEPGPEPEPPQGIVVADITKVMDETTRNAITGIDTVNYTFSFSNQTGLLQKLAVGDILADSTSEKAPYGYLRKVKKIENTKGSIKVYTEQAKLTDAVLQGTIRFNSGKLKTSQIARMKLAEGVKLRTNKNTNFTVFDMDYSMDFGSGEEMITVSGNTRLDVEFFFNFDWSFCGLCAPPEVTVDLFETGVEIDQNAAVNITSENGCTTHKRVSLATFYFEPWTFSVGPVPVVLVPKIELFLETDGTVTADFSTGASESFNGRLGTKYTSDDGWSVIKEKTFATDYFPPQIDLSASVKGNVGPEVSLLLYGIAGPFTNVTACTQLDAQLHAGTENWDLDYKIGVQTEAGVRVDVLTFEEDWSSEFCLFDFTLMHLDNEPMGTGIYFENPSDGDWLALGSNVTLKARIIGQQPSSVNFYADGTLLGSAQQAPYEFVWNTTQFTYGEHVLVVNEKIGSEVVDSDTVHIQLLNAQWEIINLSGLNQNNETKNTDVFFSSADEGWMTGGTEYGFGGYILHTNNGGKTWEQLNSGNNLVLTTEKIIFLNNNNILAITADKNVITSATWDAITYISNNITFKTFEFFEVSDMDISAGGLLVAVGDSIIGQEGYKIVLINAIPSNYEPLQVINIPYYYNDIPTAPKVYFNSNKGIVFNLKDQGNPLKQYIMLSGDGGNSWESKTLNATGITRDDDVYDAFFLNDNLGWMVGYESQGYAFVLKTSDGGTSWEKFKVPGVKSFGSVFFVDKEEGFATVNITNAANPVKLFHTQDGGETWSPVNIVNTQYAMKKVFFKGPYLGYTVGQGPEVYRFSIGK